VESDGLEGVRFRLHFRNETLHLRVPLIGRYSVHTALRAAAVGLIEGLTWQEIVNGLRSGRSQIRLVTVTTASGALILDDTYSASPESTLAALNLLEEMEGRKVAVLGEMQEVGPYGGRGHAMVGVRAAEVVDELVTLGERARIIAASALSSGLRPEQVTSFDENDQVIEFLKSHLQPKDIVLVKGSSELHMDRIAAALEDRE
jgi:UDP-N-acetylmuramoyl-tripeptide--D-alanyl-D-alanine ligase